MQRGADGGPDELSEGPVAAATVDPMVTLGLLVATLEMQRRTNLALDQLIREMAGLWRRRVRRTRSGGISRVRKVWCADGAILSKIVAAPDSDVPSPKSVPSLQVRCFGRFEVLRDGVPIDHWRRGKAKLLLKHLVVRRQPVSRDALIDLLWPDSDPQTAVNGLRVALYALRQALGPGSTVGSTAREYIIFENGNYSVNPAAGLWVDADEFTKHFLSGRRLEREGQLVAAVGHYEQAESMYRDDYLLEDLYEDWTLVRREELKDQYLLVLTKLADVCVEEGDAEGCILRCHKILQKDACREDAYRRLMRCYAQLGQPSRALHWFGLCARTLRQELDVAPSEQTMDLYQKISVGKRVDLAVVSPAQEKVTHRATRCRAVGETGGC